MPRPPSAEQVRWFADWLGPRGSFDPVPPGHESAVAILHPGTAAVTEAGRTTYRGLYRGQPGPEQKLLLSRLLLVVTGSRQPATSASLEPSPELPPQRPLDLGVRVRSDVDWILVSGRLDSLVWPAWEPRLASPQPVGALWPDDRSWCVWSDPARAHTVLAGSEELCERALEARLLRGERWPSVPSAGA